MRDTVQQEEERDWHEQLIMQISNGQPEMKDYVQRHFHQERTLDEAYYPGLSRVVLSSLNKDQVISREFNEEAKKKNGTPILMVGQLWFWRLGQTVISSSSLFEADDLDLPLRKYDTDALKLIMGLRVADCIEELGHLRERRLLPPPLQIFEAGVARILSDVTKYMDSSGSSKPDIEKERDFLKRISDIQGELAMIQDVLNQQTEVLKDVLQDPPEDFVSQDKRQGGSLSHRWDRVVRSEKTLKKFYKRTEKISADAARIEKIIQDELNLKRTFAAMEDARTSLSLGIAVIGFTVITIIFAPLAFMTSLFALPVDEFEKRKVKINSGSPEEEQEAYTASYIGKWFGECVPKQALL